nr:hypothetical protein [uncultured Acetatifactor sp.]
MDYMTFPWEQLGLLLRRLSLSGSFGNAAAWILFLATGALPLLAAAVLLRRRRACGADFLLAALSAALFVGLWFFVNPSYIDRYLSPMPAGGIAKFALASVIDSLLLTWFLLRFLLRMEKGHRNQDHSREGQHSAEKVHSMEGAHPAEKVHPTEEALSMEGAHSGENIGHGKPLSGLRILLGLYALVLAIGLIVQGGAEFRAALTALEESNSGSATFLLEISTLFLALQAVMGLLPSAAKIALLLMMSVFLHHYAADPFGPAACHAMERLRIASGRLLAVVLVANVGFNVLQLAFSRFLLSVNHQILFPLSEIIVILGIRTLSTLYLESKRLKEDNDMFI